MKIGVFDSGIGGLTIVKDLIKVFPASEIIYVGDTARVPYGTRSKDTIKKYAIEIATFLLSKEIDVLVVACNTVSAVALQTIKKISNIPVIGMIEPVVDEAVNYLGCKNIGVIGTNATINSESYERAIKKINGQIQVTSVACPLFVPLVEEGFYDNKVAQIVSKEYFQDKFKNIDCLILGCTHYPLLIKAIRKNLSKNVKILSCGEPAAREVGKTVGLVSDTKGNIKLVKHKFFITDNVEKFKNMAEVFLGQNIVKIKKLN